MRIRPVGGAAPWPYAESKELNEPRRDLGFMDVVRRLRRFNRDSILRIGSTILWHLWDNEEQLEPPTQYWEGNHITLVYAERLIALACIYGSDGLRPSAQVIDFQLLCWELHNSREPDWFGPLAVAEVRARLAGLEANSPLKRLDPELAPFLVAAAYKARVISEQTVGRHWDRGSLVRAYLIAQELRELGLQHEGYEHREQQFFLTGMEDFFRALWALYTKASEGISYRMPTPAGPVQMHEPGGFLLDDPIADEESVLEKLGLEEGALRAAASRMSISLSRCIELREQLNAVPAALRRYSRWADLLRSWPLIDVEFEGPCRTLRAPSPWRLVPAFGERVLYDFVEYLAHEGGLGNEPPYSVRGTAFGNYLRKALHGVPKFYDVDAIVGLEHKGKRPDFVWLGEEFGVLIEAKFSFKPNSDRALTGLSAALTAWERAAEPLLQARDFLNVGLLQLPSPLRMPRRWVLAVVSNESLVEEALGFKSIVKAGGLLQDIGVEAIAFVNPTEIEEWTLDATADEFGRRVTEVYEALDPYSIDQDLRLGHPPGGASHSPAHIEAAWMRVFGQKLGGAEAGSAA